MVNEPGSGPLDVSSFMQGSSTCQVSAEEMEKIFDKDISDSIDCLETNLNLYVQAVKREDAKRITATELFDFVRRFYPSLQASLEKNGDLLFTLDSILFSDSARSLSVGNLKNLFSFFRIVNQLGKRLKPVFLATDSSQYWSNRSELQDEVTRLILQVKIMLPRTSSSQTVALMDVIDKMGAKPEDREFLHSLLAVKAMVVGGTSDVISSEQFHRLLDKLPGLVILALDANFLMDRNFPDEGARFEFFLDVSHRFRAALFQKSSNNLALSHHDISVVLARLYDDKANRDALLTSLTEFKAGFVGGETTDYTFTDLTMLLNFVDEFLEMLCFNERAFDQYQKVLDTTADYRHLEFVDNGSYKGLTSEWLPDFWRLFYNQINNYSVYRDTLDYRKYARSTPRNRYGLRFIALFEKALTKLMGVYGKSPLGSSGTRDWDREDLQKTVVRFQGGLVAGKLWPDDMNLFLNDIMMGSDLFQIQSNGNGTIDPREFTEFIETSFSSAGIATQIFEHLKKDCGSDLSISAEGYTTPCYRKHFFSVFFDNLKLGSHFPGLKGYLESIDADTSSQFLKKVEAYSRIKNDENLPVTLVDLGRMVVSFSHIELIFVRFDTDGNSVLEGPELDEAFLRFKKVVMEAGNIQGKDDLAKSVFLYMIKNMKLPSTVEALWFHVFGDKASVQARRMNLASILANLPK